MNRTLPPEEYQSINVIDYVKTIKTHLRSIIAIAVSLMIIAILLGIIIEPTITYRSDAVISIGTIQEELIETREEVIESLNVIDGITTSENKNSTFIFVSSQGFSRQEAKENIEKALNPLFERHDLIYKQAKKKFDSKVQAQKIIYERSLAENETLRLRSLTMTNVLSINDPAQVQALKTYLEIYASTLINKERIELESHDLAFQELPYKETRLQMPLRVTQITGFGNLRVVTNALVGLFLGLLLGTFWAFSKTWWIKNKALLKNS
jgi:hypothetical protein